jgi:hypothetical protein
MMGKPIFVVCEMIGEFGTLNPMETHAARGTMSDPRQVLKAMKQEARAYRLKLRFVKLISGAENLVTWAARERALVLMDPDYH